MICFTHDEQPDPACDDCKAAAQPRVTPPCPKCGAPTIYGYGLCGGGFGGYQLCENDDCDFFEKRQDTEGRSA